MNAHISLMGGVPKNRRRPRGSIGNGNGHYEKGHKIDAPFIFADSRETYEIFDPRSQARVNFMRLWVDTMVGLVSDIEHNRAKIKLGDRALRQLDHEIAGLTARLRTYMSKFTDGEGNPATPDTTNWTDEDWAGYEEDLEGPVLYWNNRDWIDRWFSNPIDGPRGHRPDLLQAWMLTSQVLVGLSNQVDLVGYFWGFISISAQELASEYGGAVGDIWTDIAAAAKEKMEEARKYIEDEVLPKTGIGKLALAVTVVGVVGLGLFLFTRRRR